MNSWRRVSLVESGCMLEPWLSQMSIMLREAIIDLHIRRKTDKWEGKWYKKTAKVLNVPRELKTRCARTVATLPGWSRKKKLSTAVTGFQRRQEIQNPRATATRPAARLGGSRSWVFSLNNKTHSEHWRAQQTPRCISLPSQKHKKHRLQYPQNHISKSQMFGGFVW